MDRDATSANASDVEGDLDVTTDKVARAIALALEAIAVLQRFISISFKMHTQLRCTEVHQVTRRCSTSPVPLCALRKDTNAKAAQEPPASHVE